MNPYTFHKESGVEWVGKIPSQWDMISIKHLFNERNEKNLQGNFNYLSIVKDVGVVLYSEKGNVGNKTSDKPDRYKMVYIDDIVINPMNIIIGSVGRSRYEGCLSSVYIVLVPDSSVLSSFYDYIFSLKEFQRSLKKICYGIMELRESLNKIEFFVEKLPFPPLKEQQQISNYLDHKTQQIDSLIEKTQQKIELLKEQRTSLINQVVTKGLNPDVEMKDSGVEWIGEIPYGWEIRRIWSLGKFSKGRGIKKDEVKDNGIPCIRYGEIYTDYDRVVYSTKSFIDEKTSQNSEPIKKGDVLFTGSGETLEDIGKSIVYFGDSTIFVGGDIIILQLNEDVDPLFSSFMMNSHYVNSQKTQSGRGGIIVHIYPKQLNEIRVTLPLIQEQQQIVEYLDEQTQKIDSLIEKETQRIELLKEYRQSLISNVVTGKVDVRDEVVV